MRVVHTLVLLISMILDYIDFGVQFDYPPDDNPISRILRGDSSSNIHDLPANTLSAAEQSSRARSRSPPARTMVPPARSMVPPASTIVPPTMLPTYDGRGCGLEELSFIQLIPAMNRNRIYELRRYIFPQNVPLRLRLKNDIYTPMPTQQQIVLCTFNGDVFAILETHNVLAGMYKYDVHELSNKNRRAKINMLSDEVTSLTREEVREIPVGARRTISGCFIVRNIRGNRDHL